MSNPSFRSATELCSALRAREIGCLELLEHYLDRVERLNPQINAIVATDLEAARERATKADEALARDEVWGPLHGLPMTIKDSIEVAGMPTTSGAPELKGHIPAAHAPAVQRLIDAGAVVFGKTNLPLYAGDLQSYNEVYGTTNNPWDVTRGPGGSSGGAAAAIAAGLTGLELGSDIGGSIRNPSHYCGVYGHKPSYNLIPLRGHIPGPPGALSGSDLAVLGPLARGAEDLDLALDVMAGPDPYDTASWSVMLQPPRHENLGDFRIAAWLDDPLCPVDGEVAALMENLASALENTGLSVDRSARPGIDIPRANDVYTQLLAAQMSAGLPPEESAKLAASAASLDPEDQTYNAALARSILQGHGEWLRLNEERAHMRRSWAEFFDDFDVLLMPIMPTAAFPHDHSYMNDRMVTVNGEPFPYFGQIFWAGLATCVFLSSTVAPVGLTPGGLPVGVQVVGPHHEDKTTIHFARLLAEVVGGFVPPPDFA